MTKHTKTKRRRRSQKGGLFGFFENSDPQTQTWGEYFSNLGYKTKDTIKEVDYKIGTTAQTGMDTAKDTANSVVKTITDAVSTPSEDQSTYNPLPTTQENQSTYNPLLSTTNTRGGRHKKYSKTMKGGKGDLGLTYYATPVSGIKVVEPNNWLLYNNGTNQCSIKGGSRKRRAHKRKSRKNRRTRRHKKH